LDSYEKEAGSRGYRRIAGIDEAGRGPLAGPVVAAAVVFGELPMGVGIRDSKALSPSARARLVFEIFSSSLAVGVGVSWPPEIDSINIHRASLAAMQRAIASLGVAPEYLLVDGKFPVASPIPQRAIVRGDSLSLTIAAASIIAKTTRDNIMGAYHALYPEYDFPGNKGYPTPGHLTAIQTHGPCPIHRRSFRGVKGVPPSRYG
jgi:ribonuclease HII